jgi:hypothetical protein
MYIKIVRHLENERGVSSSKGNLEEKVVPSDHRIFECLEVQYRKVTVKNMAEFHEQMKVNESVRIITPVIDKDMDDEFEFIQIKPVVKRNEVTVIEDTLICRDCGLYIMNDEGKTIDRMICQ